METGTGKTYVYTRTIFELNKRYGFSKFIIMVPSIAIREGVHKSLEMTEEHFKEIYGKKLRYFIYDAKRPSNLTNIKSFAESNDIWVMIMNYQAFATKSKESRKIYEELDLMNSNKPIDVIRSTRPILIIDEPQKFGERLRVSSKSSIHSLSYATPLRIKRIFIKFIASMQLMPTTKSLSKILA